MGTLGNRSVIEIAKNSIACGKSIGCGSVFCRSGFSFCAQPMLQHRFAAIDALGAQLPPGSEVIRSVVQSVINLYLRRTEVVSRSARLQIAQRRGRAPESLKCKSHMIAEEHFDRK